MKNQKVNTQGLDINQDLLETLRNFKQGQILENSYLRFQHSVPTEMMELESRLGAEVADEFIKRDCMKGFADTIWNKYNEEIEIDRSPAGKVYRLDLMVMHLKDLKHVVEYCVRTMPESAIQRIRNNENI